VSRGPYLDVLSRLVNDEPVAREPTKMAGAAAHESIPEGLQTLATEGHATDVKMAKGAVT
jgi:hypothetical protein